MTISMRACGQLVGRVLDRTRRNSRYEEKKANISVFVLLMKVIHIAIGSLIFYKSRYLDVLPQKSHPTLVLLIERNAWNSV